MKISDYTFHFDIDNKEFYLYSSLSNALIEIDETTYQILSIAKKENLEILPSELDREIYDVLVIKKFIVENDLDNFLFYKSVIEKQRVGPEYMHMTIAPTMECCFKCHYCFEKIKEKDYMSEEVMNSIINYLHSLKSEPEFKLTWFGGEPLMALPQMEHFYEKLVERYKKPVNSNIITSGFHIDAEAIRTMQKIGVDQIQVTIDGLKETHNKV